MAQAGGTEPGKLPHALETVAGWVKQRWPEAVQAEPADRTLPLHCRSQEE